MNRLDFEVKGRENETKCTFPAEALPIDGSPSSYHCSTLCLKKNYVVSNFCNNFFTC